MPPTPLHMQLHHFECACFEPRVCVFLSLVNVLRCLDLLEFFPVCVYFPSSSFDLWSVSSPLSNHIVAKVCDKLDIFVVFSRLLFLAGTQC